MEERLSIECTGPNPREIWCVSPGPPRHIDAADRFALAIPEARPIDILRALLGHHARYGGGLRWFVLRDDQIELGTPWRGGSSLYRFRLWSLCRLAAQCGVIRGMPIALRRATRRKRTIPERPAMSSVEFGWQSLLHTDAPVECSLKAALFTTYDRADELFLVEHLLPLLLKLEPRTRCRGSGTPSIF